MLTPCAWSPVCKRLTKRLRQQSGRAGTALGCSCTSCAEIMTTTVCEYCGYDIRARARAAGEKAQRDATANEVLGTAAAIGLFGVVGGAIVDDMTGGQTKKSYFSRKKKR